MTKTFVKYTATERIETQGVVRTAKEQFTGNQIVVLNKETSSSRFVKAAANASMRIANIRDFRSLTEGSKVAEALSQADGVVFDKLKIAVVPASNSAQMVSSAFTRAAARSIVQTEPERIVYALARRSGDMKFVTDAASTWSLKAANCFPMTGKQYTGKGVRIAILDTGIHESHPDFAGRIKESKSFVRRSQVEDGNGHGTHCAGIATGNKTFDTSMRYGVAPEAELYIGKVLSNRGEGTDGQVFEAIEWSLENKCRIISMSFGSEIKRGEKYYESYEMVAKDALKNNCLLIAAAGNESNRPRTIRPINHPANCPSILSVGALDANLEVAYYSCGGTALGALDIAAPGDEIFSTWKNGRYRIESGTSMATPFVAGVAALYAEKYKHFTMNGVKAALLRYAKKLPYKKTDVGKGMVYFK